jgi:serine/threonine protein kinase
MIRADGEPMIIDFGAIKLIGQETQLRSEAKTFAIMKQFYSPPEQIEEGGELDRRADIYSIGAVLYRAFSGRPPASAEERMQKLAFAKPDPYLPLAEEAPHLAPALAAAVDRAISFNADERQTEVAELRDELGWPEEASVPTFVIPRDNDGELVRRRSILPWLLPLIGIAAVGGVIAYSNGFVALPKFETEVVKAPEPPKLDDVKEVPQAPVHTPDSNPPKQETADDGYMVVVASYKTEQEAQTALAELKKQLPSLFADQDTEVVGIDLGDSGRFYRAMVGPLVKEDADALCQELKRKNVACLVRMNN